MSAGTIRQVSEGVEYDLPDVPRSGGKWVVGVSATEEGVLVVAEFASLTTDETRTLAEYLLEAAAWVEAVSA